MASGDKKKIEAASGIWKEWSRAAGTQEDLLELQRDTLRAHLGSIKRLSDIIDGYHKSIEVS